MALVTGAGSGIGREIAIALGSCGAQVVVNYRRNSSGAEETVASILASGGRGRTHQADVSEPAAVTKMFREVEEKEGRLDILVNNAGDPVAAKPLGEWTVEEMDQVWANNLRSVFLCSRAAAPIMRKQGGGRIINISSIGASSGGSAWTLPYAAMKGGVETFTRGLARVLGADGITVNCISPGSIRTPLQQKFATREYLARMAADTALGREGEPREVAAAALYFASDGAAFVTGQVLRVDGGRRA